MREKLSNKSFLYKINYSVNKKDIFNSRSVPLMMYTGCACVWFIAALKTMFIRTHCYLTKAAAGLPGLLPNYSEVVLIWNISPFSPRCLEFSVHLSSLQQKANQFSCRGRVNSMFLHQHQWIPYDLSALDARARTCTFTLPKTWNHWKLCQC